MKRYLISLTILLFIAGCGAGGGVSSLSDGQTGGSSDQNNGNNPPPSAKSKIAKIKVNKDGIYRIAFSDLNTANVDLSGKSTDSLKMINNGEEIAIDVIDQNKIGIFDDGDSIEFYGKAIARGDKNFRYTETNVYWLSSEGGIGKRVKKVVSTSSSSSQGGSSFLKVLHNEEDTWYEQKNYPEVTTPEDVREHWFWGEAFSTPGLSCGNLQLTDCKKNTDLSYSFQRTYNFSTYGIDPNTTVYLKVHLQSIKGDHHVRVYLNNNLVPVIDKVWSGDQPVEISSDSISASDLRKTLQNVLTIESVGDTESGIYEFFYLDWFDVSFYHAYQVEHDRLDFSGNGLINISNFTSKNISIYDINSYPDIKKLTPDSIDDIGSGYYKAMFSAPDNQDSKFIALTSSEKKKPLAVEAYTPADLKSAKDFDYIIITHEDFYDAVKPLADYRGKDYKVLTVKIGDIYDEFGYGVETPNAVRAFLAYAYNYWTIKPKYVLLVGDATIDYKDISTYGKNNGVKSYVPAYLYNYPVLGEVPSDNWFVDVDDKNGILPEMNIGRIPAKTPADVSAVIEKIKSHEETISHSKRVLLVADDDLQVFETLSNSIAELIPGDYSVLPLYQKDFANGFREKIIKEINSGALVVNYTGHGSVVEWTKENVFSSQDTAYLTNKGTYPFVVALNCLNGYFVLPNEGVDNQSPSIAESFLMAPERGSVAVFAASSIGYPSEHDPLANALYAVLFENVITLGEAVTRAKETACNYGMDTDETYRCKGVPEDVVQTFIFFGDPATRLK